MQKMFKQQLTADEWRMFAGRYGLNYTDACRLLFMETGVVLNPKNISKAFNAGDQLSQPMSAAFRLLFQKLEAQYGNKEI